jgi:hypothetical protein
VWYDASHYNSFHVKNLNGKLRFQLSLSELYTVVEQRDWCVRDFGVFLLVIQMPNRDMQDGNFCQNHLLVKLYLPLWIPLAVFAAYPTLALIQAPVRRWRRYRKGRCLNCGYDLTGNVSGVCPECGIEVKQP